MSTLEGSESKLGTRVGSEPARASYASTYNPTHPVWVCQGCGETVSGRKTEHCPVPGCHQSFTSTSTGDKHRTGDWETRRCLTVEEMRAAGMRQNRHGVWTAGGDSPWA